MEKILETIKSPADIRGLDYAQLEKLAAEIRGRIIATVGKTGGHLAANLGVVELKNYWKKMYYETVEKYNKLKNKGANEELKEKLEMLNQSISDVLDNWDEEDDRHKELLMCIDDEIDLDGNNKPGTPGMIIE